MRNVSRNHYKTFQTNIFVTFLRQICANWLYTYVYRYILSKNYKIISFRFIYTILVHSAKNLNLRFTKKTLFSVYKKLNITKYNMICKYKLRIKQKCIQIYVCTLYIHCILYCALYTAYKYMYLKYVHISIKNARYNLHQK